MMRIGQLEGLYGVFGRRKRFLVIVARGPIESKVEKAVLRIRVQIASCLLTCLLSICAAAAIAQTSYTVTDLGTVGGATSSPYAINSSGAVTGVSTPAIPGVGLAFTWSPPNGPIKSIGTLPGNVSSVGFSINDSGWITGQSGEEAFLYTPQNGMQPLGFLSAGTLSAGSCVNNHGVVVGTSGTVGSIYLNPFLWTASGGMIDLNSTITNMPSGWTPSAARLINNNGVIAGIGYPNIATSPPSGIEHAFVLNAGTLTEIPNPAAPNGRGIQPEGLNESGEVVGLYFDSDGGEHGFVYTAALGTREILGLGGSQTVAFSVNDYNQIVGGTTLLDGSYRAYLYTDTSGLIDLNSLAPINGWTLEAATGINDSGQIVAQGFNAQGASHAFLLTPVPEPAALTILAPFVLALLIRYKARTRRTAVTIQDR
jgi:probable HAF family extracellular repeat protein